jgi:hypothetical protein
MDYKIVLGIIATIIGLIGYAPYFRDIFIGKTKPHVFSWFIWSVLTCIAFVAQVIEGAGAGAWVTGFTALICFVISILAVKYGEKQITRIDSLCLFGALVGIVLWLLTDNPLAAVVLITVTDALAFIPTFRKTYHKPEEETLIEYFLASVKFLVGLFALESFNLTTTLYPASLVLMNGAFVVMVLRRRKLISNI